MVSSLRPRAVTPLHLLCLVLLAITVVSTGCATPRFTTYARIDTTYDFDSVNTYAFAVRREIVKDSANGMFVEKALRKGLNERGFEEVAKADAQVHLSYDIGVYSYGGLSGRNANPSRQQGDITVWVFDAQTGKNVWYGWAETVLHKSDEPEPTINEAVQALLNHRRENNAPD